jgi:hypothetical protein
MVRKRKSLLLGLVLAGLAGTSGAMNVQSTSASQISSVDVYTAFGGGDAIVHLTSNSLSGSCPLGFWISGTDPGGKSALAQIMAAQAVGGSVVIAADIASIWSGNGNTAACQVWSVTRTGT